MCDLHLYLGTDQRRSQANSECTVIIRSNILLTSAMCQFILI